MENIIEKALSNLDSRYLTKRKSFLCREHLDATMAKISEFLIGEGTKTSVQCKSAVNDTRSSLQLD